MNEGKDSAARITTMARTKTISSRVKPRRRMGKPSSHSTAPRSAEALEVADSLAAGDGRPGVRFTAVVELVAGGIDLILLAPGILDPVLVRDVRAAVIILAEQGGDIRGRVAVV